MKVFARGHIQSQNDSPYFEELILHTKISVLSVDRHKTLFSALPSHFCINQKAKQEEKAFLYWQNIIRIPAWYFENASYSK